MARTERVSKSEREHGWPAGLLILAVAGVAVAVTEPVLAVVLGGVALLALLAKDGRAKRPRIRAKTTESTDAIADSQEPCC